MTTLILSQTIANKLTLLAQRTGRTPEQVIADFIQQSETLRPIPTLSPNESALAEETASDKFSDQAVTQRWGMKEL